MSEQSRKVSNGVRAVSPDKLTARHASKTSHASRRRLADEQITQLADQERFWDRTEHGVKFNPLTFARALDDLSTASMEQGKQP
jgi:hypothetical protein